VIVDSKINTEIMIEKLKEKKYKLSSFVFFYIELRIMYIHQ